MNSSDLEVFESILSKNGYRITNARKLTYRFLNSPHPQSINEIIKKAEGNVDRVSVYRCVELFEKLGIVNRIYIGWKYKLELSETFIEHHHHMSCLDCGKAIDIKDTKYIDEFINEVSKREGFTPKRHTFEITGYCNNCIIE